MLILYSALDYFCYVFLEFMSNPFNYLRNQRVALVILALLCVIVVAVDINIKSAPAEVSEQDSIMFSNELSRFRETLDTVSYKSGYERNRRYDYNQKAQLFHFNPNTLDSAGFVALGLKPFVAVRIVNYRKAGGVFRTKQDLARINNLRRQDYERLYPYIDLPESIEKPALEFKKEAEIKDNTLKQKKITSVVDINVADTAILVAAGFSSGVAKCLKRERDKFGGFVNEGQVREALKWMSNKEQVEDIVSHLRIDVGKVRKINVNTASIDRLRSHPYINFNQAKAIFEYRRTYGRLTSIDDLRKVEDASITPDFIERVRPYLEAR